MGVHLRRANFMRVLFSFNRAGSHVSVRALLRSLCFYLVFSPASTCIRGISAAARRLFRTHRSSPLRQKNRKLTGHPARSRSVSRSIFPPGRNGLQPDVSLDLQQSTHKGQRARLRLGALGSVHRNGQQNGVTEFIHDGWYTAPTFASSIDESLRLRRPQLHPPSFDTLDLPTHGCTVCSSDSFTYTVPSGGSNKLLVLLILSGVLSSPSANPERSPALYHYALFTGR